MEGIVSALSSSGASFGRSSSSPMATYDFSDGAA
jgi:hypothetical protein